MYCAICNETISGCTGLTVGTDIASALGRILNAVLEDNEWDHKSDYSVWFLCITKPQFSHIECCSRFFKRENPSMNSIIKNYSLPGHSCMHIVLLNIRWRRLLTLVRILKRFVHHNPYCVIQMKTIDYKGWSHSYTSKLQCYALHLRGLYEAFTRIRYSLVQI